MQAHALATGGAHDHPPEEDRHESLRDRRAQARPRNPHAERVHEHPVRHRVEPGEQGRGEDRQEDRGEEAEASRQPHGLDPRANRKIAPPGPQVTPRQGRRRVGEEDEKPDRRIQHGRRDTQARQLRGPQVTDHRRIDDGKQRLGDESPQGGQRERQDHPRRDRRRRRGRGLLTLRR